MSPLANLRVGQGVDVHAFNAARPLVLGGVSIPGGPGLEGHSDADVLLHAIIDALLGAAGKSDIGTYFPNTAAEWQGISSLVLLEKCWALLRDEGWQVINIDCSVLAEIPKLGPYIPAMKSAISRVLGVESSRIGIKATTSEKLGFVGRREGMLASAVALVERLG